MDPKPEKGIEQQVRDFILDNLNKLSKEEVQIEKFVFAKNEKNNFDLFTVTDIYPNGLVVIEKNEEKTKKNINDLYPLEGFRSTLQKAEAKFGLFNLQKALISFKEIMSNYKPSDN